MNIPKRLSRNHFARSSSGGISAPETAGPTTAAANATVNRRNPKRRQCLPCKEGEWHWLVLHKVAQEWKYLWLKLAILHALLQFLELVKELFIDLSAFCKLFGILYKRFLGLEKPFFKFIE